MRKYKFYVKTSAFLVCLLSISSIYAGHPLRTDDAAVIGKNNLELEISSEFSTQSNYNEIGFPIAFTFGLFSNTDIAISTCGHHSWVTGIQKQSALGDFVLEVKSVFHGEIFDFGIKPFVTLPTGNSTEGFGTGKTTYGIYFLFTKHYEKLSLYSQAGYQRNNNIINEDHDHWEISFAGEYSFSEEAAFVLEIGGARDLNPRDEEHPIFLLGGVLYNLSNSIVFDFGLLKGINKTEADLGILTGLTFAL